LASRFTATLDWQSPEAGELLGGYAHRFGASDAATLLIHGGTPEDVGPGAAALGEASPDMVLVEQIEAAALEPRIDAVLASGHAEGALAGLPWLGAGDLRALYDLRLPGMPRAHRFTCNLCGVAGIAETRGWPRDTGTCRGCGSAARFRGLAGLIARELFGSSAPLHTRPARGDLAGVGMSDPLPLAAVLGRKMAYANTYYHCEPRLDFCAPGDHAGRYDLVVCSEVLEHVPPPIEPAFTGLRDLLRPGGLLVFSVPYRSDGETTEHFPALHDYEILVRDGEHVLRNTRPVTVGSRSTTIWSSTAVPARRSSCASSPCPTCSPGSRTPDSSTCASTANPTSPMESGGRGRTAGPSPLAARPAE
jgi:SAM-dependent methyltransferase